ncbi:unnamed protein product [Eruca vesicaria subsp. sativa]|uniref:Uncharacterized protein n=1 Tax=Eruca vesicaria subsp. sativa TaxID=29727 RepID=A0ABC8KNJ5_ERUVS|nr:unnamed protein product [Eruca vesicaria subsp. sativa]
MELVWMAESYDVCYSDTIILDRGIFLLTRLLCSRITSHPNSTLVVYSNGFSLANSFLLLFFFCLICCNNQDVAAGCFEICKEGFEIRGYIYDTGEGDILGLWAMI